MSPAELAEARGVIAALDRSAPGWRDGPSPLRTAQLLALWRRGTW